jgi:membrane protein DedA with SNARE-associated domain
VSVPHWLSQAIAMYGYWAILVAVALETMGVPFPGETSLLAGAVYAGTGGPLNIVAVIIAGAAGAILGDNIGFTVGYIGGYPLLRRLTRLVRVDEAVLLHAQRYFEQHGDKTVLIGRFFAFLRLWVAFLAGVNRMPRRVFLVWNATGGILWALVYGLIGYFLGRNISLLNSVVSAMGLAGAIVIALFFATLVGLWFYRRRRERTLLQAETREWMDEEPADPRAVRLSFDRSRLNGHGPDEIAAKQADEAGEEGAHHGP